jgi:hypothetical protein
MKLDSNPDIFSLIVEYLSGYPILPLDEAMVPRRMSVQSATRYLVKDADYLGLAGLHELLVRPRMDTRAFEEWADTERYGVNLVDVLSDRLPSSVVPSGS